MRCLAKLKYRHPNCNFMRSPTDILRISESTTTFVHSSIENLVGITGAYIGFQLLPEYQHSVKSLSKNVRIPRPFVSTVLINRLSRQPSAKRVRTASHELHVSSSHDICINDPQMSFMHMGKYCWHQTFGDIEVAIGDHTTACLGNFAVVNLKR